MAHKWHYVWHYVCAIYGIYDMIAKQSIVKKRNNQLWSVVEGCGSDTATMATWKHHEMYASMLVWHMVYGQACWR